MKTIVVRGASGLVVWVPQKTKNNPVFWVCQRDQFQVEYNPSPANAESVLVALATHSATLVGAISQVVELDI
jgi:hypothetical protein